MELIAFIATTITSFMGLNKICWKMVGPLGIPLAMCFSMGIAVELGPFTGLIVGLVLLWLSERW